MTDTVTVLIETDRAALFLNGVSQADANRIVTDWSERWLRRRGDWVRIVVVDAWTNGDVPDWGDGRVEVTR